MAQITQWLQAIHNCTSVKINKNEIGCRDDTMLKTVEMKSTEVQTLGAYIWPGVDALLRVREALRKRMRSRTCNGKYTEDYKSKSQLYG